MSVRERSSTTKSGQSGGNFSCSSSVNASHRSFLTHAKSGERFAPFGSVKTVEEAVEVAGKAVSEGATELHIVGGLNTKLPFKYYTDLLASLKRAYPRLHLKAFTMVELDHMTGFYKMSDEDVIEELKQAGMDSCPGGGAEIFREPTRSKICAHKTDAERWLALAGKVHAAGLKTNATMLYGHIESIADRVDHLVRLREQQDASGGFHLSHAAPARRLHAQHRRGR